MALPVAVNVVRAAEVLRLFDESEAEETGLFVSAKPTFSPDAGEAPAQLAALAGKCVSLNVKLAELVRETKSFLRSAIISYAEKDSDLASQM